MITPLLTWCPLLTKVANFLFLTIFHTFTNNYRCYKDNTHGKPTQPSHTHLPLNIFWKCLSYKLLLAILVVVVVEGEGGVDTAGLRRHIINNTNVLSNMSICIWCRKDNRHIFWRGRESESANLYFSNVIDLPILN